MAVSLGLGLMLLVGRPSAAESAEDSGKPELPAAVRKAVMASFPGAEITDFKAKKKDGALRYELKLRDELNGEKPYKVLLSESGQPLKEDLHRIHENRLPQKVRLGRVSWAGIKAQAIWHVKREEKKGARYRVELTPTAAEFKGKRYKAEFDEDGALLKGDKAPAPKEPVAAAVPKPAPTAPSPEKPKASAGDTKPKQEEMDPDVLRKVKKLIRGTLKEDEEDRQKAWAEIRDMGNLAVPGLLAVFRLKSTTAPMVRSILIALEDSKDSRSGPALVEVLGHKDAGIRAAAARAIGSSKYHSGIEALRKRYSDSDEDIWVRYYAACAAAKLGERKAVGCLKKLLDSPRADVRSRAAYALGKHGKTDELQALAGVLADKDRGVREEAVDALRRIGGQGARGPLVKATGDEDYKIRNAAMDALRGLTGKKFEKPAEWQAWWTKENAKKDGAK